MLVCRATLSGWLQSCLHDIRHLPLTNLFFFHLTLDEDGHPDERSIDRSHQVAKNSSSAPRRRKRIKFRFRSPKPAEEPHTETISEKHSSSRFTWNTSTLRFRSGRRRIIEQGIPSSLHSKRPSENPNSNQNDHQSIQSGPPLSPAVSLAEEASSISSQHRYWEGILPPAPPSPHPIIQPPPQPPESGTNVPATENAPVILRGHHDSEHAPPAINATVSPPAYNQEGRGDTNNSSRTHEDPAYGSRPRSGKERMADGYCDEDCGLEEFRSIARYPANNAAQPLAFEPTSPRNTVAVDTLPSIPHPTEAPVSRITTHHLATDDKAVLESIRLGAQDGPLHPSEPPGASDGGTQVVARAPAWEDEYSLEAPGPSSLDLHQPSNSIFPPPSDPGVQHANPSNPINSPYRLPAPPLPLSQTLSATDLPLYVGSTDMPFTENKHAMDQTPTWLLPSAPPSEPPVSTLSEDMNSALPPPSAPQLPATDEDDGTLDGLAGPVSMTMSGPDGTTVGTLQGGHDLPRYEP